MGFITSSHTTLMLVGVRAVCGTDPKARLKASQALRTGRNMASPNHRTCGLPGLVSRCVRLASVVRSAPSTVVPMVDLSVPILILCRLFHTSKLVFRRKKGAPRLLRFILGAPELFQEPMDPLKTPMVSPNHYMKFGFPGIFSVIGLSSRCGGTAIIT